MRATAAVLIFLLCSPSALAQTSRSRSAPACARCERHLARALSRLTLCQDKLLVAPPSAPTPLFPAQIELTHKTETPAWVWWTLGLAGVGLIVSTAVAVAMANNASLTSARAGR